MTDTMTVGFVGLGDQGGPMAQRVVEAGFPTVVWGRRHDALEPFVKAGARQAANLADLGARTDHLGVCVVDDAGVRQVVEGVLPTMRGGSRIAIHSTVHPDTCVALAETARSRDVALIDAPVSGGGRAAAAGTLTVLIGGDEAAVAAARPVFATFGGLILHLGGIGAGQRAKLVNNTLMAANMALADAAFATAERLGIERAAFVDLIGASSGRSYGFDVRARLPSADAFAQGATLLAKDVGLLGRLIGDDPGFAVLAGTALPFLSATLATFQRSSS